MGAIFITFILILFNFSPAIGETNNKSGGDGLETYIVYVKKPQHDVLFSQKTDLDNWYQSFLPETIPDRESRMVRCYRNVISGFAARLIPDELKAMGTKSGFISAHVEKKLQLHTTHTSEFLGLRRDSGLWKEANYGKGIIIGVLDTGVTPQHPSFSGEGFPPPPAKWKGKCEFKERSCNNKIIGYRNFYNRTSEPIDLSLPATLCHGTHASSLAAGNFVEGANVWGLANGTAVGTAPSAHLAIYKLHDDGDAIRDLPAMVGDAIVTAVDDGVDVLSLSIGVGQSDYFDNSIAIATFYAVKKGVFVSISAANSGPAHNTLVNDAPWMLTVGASTIDRRHIASIQLGNQASYDGEIYTGFHDLPLQQSPLIYAVMKMESNETNFYAPETMEVIDVKGKIVLCKREGFRVSWASHLLQTSGAAAAILINQDFKALPDLNDHENDKIPSMQVSIEDGESMKAYINSTSSSPPTASIVLKGSVIGKKTAPEVAQFSSRGPSNRTTGILKPDIVSPGANILGASCVSVDGKTDPDFNHFRILSGTSMSSPIASGVAALLKNTHPDWTPAMIKSAMMTTADILNLEGKPILDYKPSITADLFALGAGHINPTKSNDPGLVYDIQLDDYISILCGLYTDAQVQHIVQSDDVQCTNVKKMKQEELNYPTFSITFGSSSQTYKRTVMNVGDAVSSYTAEVVAPEGVEITVEPKTLSFTEKNQNATYSVTFTRTQEDCGDFSKGYLTWVSGYRSVRSPIAFTFEK